MTKWHPEVGTGFFFLGDNQYYLYASKKIVYLDDITWYIYKAEHKINLVTKAMYGTYTIDSSCIKIQDDEIWFNLKFLNPTHDAGYHHLDIFQHEILFSYTYLTEVNGELQQKENSNILIKLHLSPRRYFLDPKPVSPAPIIWTDYEISPMGEQRVEAAQFRVDYTTGELFLLNRRVRNVVANATFALTNRDIAQRVYPSAWVSHTDEITRLFTISDVGYYGQHSYILGNFIGSGGLYTSVPQAEAAYLTGDHIRQNYIYQEVPIPDTFSNTVSLSCMASVVHPNLTELPNDSQLFMRILFIDSDGKFINAAGVQSLNIQGLIDNLRLQVQNGEFLGQTVSKDWETYSVSALIPDNTVGIGIFLSGAGCIKIDGVQCSSEYGDFEPTSSDVLIEYESSAARTYQATDVDLNPAHNTSNSGILQVANVPDPQTMKRD